MNIEQIHLLRIEEDDIFIVFVPEKHIAEISSYEHLHKRVRDAIKAATGRDVPVVVFPDTFRVGVRDEMLSALRQCLADHDHAVQEDVEIDTTGTMERRAAAEDALVDMVRLMTGGRS